MKKLSIIMAIVFAGSGLAFGQMGTPLSQYSGNQLAYNPGFTGIYDLLAANLSVRQSWMGLEGAPKIININAHAPLRGGQHSWGGSYQMEEYGNITENLILGSYAYKLFFEESVLSLGLHAGISHYLVDWDAIEYVSDWTDPTLKKGRLSNINFDASFGLHYMQHNWYVGLSAMHLNQPKFDIHEINGTTWYSQMGTQFFLMGGFNRNLTQDWSLRPEFLMRFVQHAPVAANLGAYVFFQGNYGLGVHYVSGQKTISFGAKIVVIKGFRVGYSYDVALGALKSYQSGSHEISINYTTEVWGKHGRRMWRNGR
ncbi:MAG: PorP/SprF family type IX secretion system membrane protein [Bacteroidales bacterium]|jgi:type IX secretion system PorP/SprF family membrane protein|nr:PorP/SprF family type IX secretion system membrane protein [Bacteroidales bacterium]